MHGKKVYLISAVIIFLICIFVFYIHLRANNKLNKTLSIIQEKFNKIDNYSVDYYVMNNGEHEAFGRSIFIKPNKIKIEDYDYLTKSLRGILFFDNNYEWWYFPQGNTAIKQRLKKNINPRYKFLTYIAPFRNILSLRYSDRSKDITGEYVVLEAEVGSIDTKGPGSDKYKFFIDLNNGLVKKFTYYDKNLKKIITHEFKNYKINLANNQRDIEFNLPKDVKISEIN